MNQQVNTQATSKKLYRKRTFRIKVNTLVKMTDSHIGVHRFDSKLQCLTLAFHYYIPWEVLAMGQLIGFLIYSCGSPRLCCLLLGSAFEW